MTTQTESRKFPAPIYAAAGAGDFAYQQLRRLPTRVAELRERVVELRPVVAEAVSERRLRDDVERMRELAVRNAATVVTGAQVAQERAVRAYSELVARGERIVAGARSAEAKAQLLTAQAETRAAAKAEAELTAEETRVEIVDAQAKLPTVPAKPVKRTRPVSQR